MLGSVQRIAWMQRTGLRFLEIFQDDRGFKDRMLGGEKHRRPAERRYLQEPFRLVGEIDIDPLEWNSLLCQRNSRALNIGAEFVADQLEPFGHGRLDLMHLHVNYMQMHESSRTDRSGPCDYPAGHGDRHAGCSGIAERQAFQPP